MVINDEVLNFFREELPVIKYLGVKNVPLEMDTVLQEFADAEDLIPAIDKYSDNFNIDVSTLNIENYYPWEIPWFFRKWFTKKPVKQTRKPLTVKMFAESAKAGRWLYD